MPLIESKPDAVANTYARSLFEMAEAEGGRERTETILDQLEDVLEMARSDSRFGEFLASRVLGVKAREGAMRRIFEGRCDDLLLRFLLVLNMKERLGHLPAIVAAYDAIVQERFGRVEVDVFTAAPVSANELAAVRERLGRALSKDVVVHPYVDESIIGGIRFRIGDQLVDASVATRLRRMREQLASRGAAAVRGNAARIIDNQGGA